MAIYWVKKGKILMVGRVKKMKGFNSALKTEIKKLS